MKNSTAAGKPSDNSNIVSLCDRCVNLCPVVLVLSYYDGLLILPEVEDDFILYRILGQIFF